GLLGFVWYFKGRLDAAGDVAERSIEWARQSGDRWAYGMMRNLLAGVRLWRGRTREALEHAEQAQRIFAEIDDAIGLTMSTNTLATGYLMTGRRDEALQLAETQRERTGVAGGIGGVLGSAMLHAVAGATDDALDILRPYESIGESDGSDPIPDIDVVIGLVYLLAGRSTDAYDRAARAWASDPADPGERANMGCMLALAAAAAGHPQEAITAGDESLRAGGTYLDQLRAHIGRAFAYAQLGDRSASEDAMASARTIADATQDDLDRALVGLASAVLHNADEASYTEDLRALHVDWEPWMRAFRFMRSPR